MREVFAGFVLFFGVLLVLGFIGCFIGFLEKGPHVFEYWELSFQERKIEVQAKEKCLHDKFYCNPAAFNVDIKGLKEEAQ